MGLKSGMAGREHPRTVGWFGTTSVAMGGMNQSLFIMAALFVEQGDIPGQGSAAVLLLIAGVLLAWAAAPGWTELVLMFPNRVGGIAATCAEAFRPYSPVLANLTGVCYWWGWAPACAVGAMLSASALHEWYFPWCPVPILGTCIILLFMAVNLCGVKWVMRLAMPIAVASAGLAFVSATVPIFSGHVDWHQAFTFKLTVPFPGWFGGVTSVMAGLYLIGFLAPAFEQAASHVGETIDPNRNVPRAMLASAALAGLYFIVLPLIWLGTLGPEALAQDLALVLGPTFAPLVGGAAKATAIWFMVLNMFHGVIAPLAGASRTLSQLAEDGLLPEAFARRSRTDVPWVATVVTAGVAIACLFAGVPLWLIAAANFTYLISIALASIAVWLLRRDRPDLPRPYRAPRGTIILGLGAGGVWTLTTLFGFQQFGLPTVLAGIAFAYSGAMLYAWRKASDRRKLGLPVIGRSLHLKLTGAMLLVLVLDAGGYLIAIHHVPVHETALLAILADIFVAVALLTISVGLVLPGMIAHAAVEVSKAADQLVRGTLADFTRAMQALAAGDLDAAKAQFDLVPVAVHSRDEVGDMAMSFNKLQEEIGRAALGLEGARAGLSAARDHLELRVRERTAELESAHKKLLETSRMAGMAEVATNVLHNVGNVLNSVNIASACVANGVRKSKGATLTRVVRLLREHETDLGGFFTTDHRAQQMPGFLDQLSDRLAAERAAALNELGHLQKNIDHIKEIVAMQQSYAKVSGITETVQIVDLVEDTLRMNAECFADLDVQVVRDFAKVPPVTVERHKVLQILVNLVRNARHACDATDRPDKTLTLQVFNGAGTIKVAVSDNGIGIAAENLARIFNHGFTTKKDGHGYGLHSGALAARELGGALRAESPGLGRGATFTLELPTSA